MKHLEPREGLRGDHYVFAITTGSPLWCELPKREDNTTVYLSVFPAGYGRNRVWLDVRQESDLPFATRVHCHAVRPSALGIDGFDELWRYWDVEDENVHRPAERPPREIVAGFEYQPDSDEEAIYSICAYGVSDRDVEKLIAELERMEEAQFWQADLDHMRPGQIERYRQEVEQRRAEMAES